ncbi:GTP binding domain [Fusarium albosuccineum]|uniref:GTP binding domain n=1 Tax=Fusarium albosuccineum TaxID=1237068 RepID=A0A8H4LFS3_9HYPO|nr:GTP binding domain [Fusarium albosuccineum]
MGDIDLAAESLAEKAKCFSAFIGMTRPDPSDRFFLVTGTTSVDVFEYTQNGQRVFLVDTPGFNDTTRSDINTLEILATYLGASYANGVRIHGIIMLHPISDNRMTGSSLRNIDMLKAICGFTSYENLLIATTMWPDTSSYTEKKTLEEREVELLTDDRFFGALVAQGARMFRHNERGRRDSPDEAASAQRIMAYLVNQANFHPPDVLQLQREMVDRQLTLGKTAAGIAAARDLHKARQDHERQLKELKAKMTDQLAMFDAAHTAQLQELKSDVERKLEKADDDQQVLKRTMEDMHEAEAKALGQRLKELDWRFREQVAAKEQDLSDLEASLRAIKNDNKQLVMRNSAAHEAILKKTREEATQNRVAYNRFRGQTGNIINGTMNGIAAGTLSGVIAAGKFTYSKSDLIDPTKRD